MQTKKRSMFESITNVVIGFGVAVISQRLVFPMFDIHVPISDNIGIAVWFTVISIARSYAIRRIFNRRDR